MKTHLFSVLMLCIGMQANAQLYWDWAKTANNAQSATNYMVGAATTVDDAGNVYVATTVADTVLIGSTLIKPRPIGDALVIKYDKDGVVLWVKAITGTYDGAVAQSVVIGPNSDVYVSGWAKAPIYADNIVATGDATYDSELFLTKLDANGNFLWVKTANGSNGWSHLLKNHQLSVDDDNNIYLSTAASVGTNYYFDTIMTLPYGGTSVTKFDADGNVKWRHLWFGNFIWGGGLGGVEVKICSNKDLVYALPLQRDENTDSSHTIYTNLIMGKLDSNGNTIWHKEYGDTALLKWHFGNAGYDIELDKEENIYLWGSYSKAYKIGPGPNGGNNGSGFLAKFNTGGGLLWSKFVSGPLAVFPAGLGYHKSEEQLLCTGGFLGTISFDGYTLTTPSNAVGHTFVIAYNTTGGVEWFTTMGGAMKTMTAYSAYLNNTAKVYAVTGGFKDSISFGTLGINSGGLNQQDMFIAVAKFDTLTTSLPMQLAGFDFKVYPNPVSNVLSVETEHGSNGLNIILLDVNGKTVYIGRMENEKMMIPVAALPNGQYLLSVNNGTSMLAKPVIVRH